MAFPPQFLDELRVRVPLAGVVGRRVKLARKGREHQGLCPFHNEKTPSFTVNEDKGFFHCFGCGAHGDAIGFEMRAGHLSFTEAVERLASELGLEVPAATPEERRQEQRRASLHDAMEAACVFFEHQLLGPAGREGLAYLKNRGLSDATIARFRLGWAPDSREALKGALMSDRLPEAMLVEAGLLKKPEHGGASFDLFRGRVTFPITDRRGRVIAFGARTMGDHQPKYLNSPETPLFHKGSTLYGLAHAREQARTRGVALAVEGYMDVIALHQAGFDYAVAPLGTALTEEQIQELWRLADEPILSFDGDSAGQRAMARAAERALPILVPGKSLRFAVLPHPE
ncbi:MAG: DNA primase, partial [Solirubrobacterales bacterium]